jgi:hypothetical protein
MAVGEDVGGLEELAVPVGRRKREKGDKSHFEMDLYPSLASTLDAERLSSSIAAFPRRATSSP